MPFQRRPILPGNEPIFFCHRGGGILPSHSFKHLESRIHKKSHFKIWNPFIEWPIASSSQGFLVRAKQHFMHNHSINHSHLHLAPRIEAENRQCWHGTGTLPTTTWPWLLKDTSRKAKGKPNKETQKLVAPLISWEKITQCFMDHPGSRMQIN